MGLDPTCMHTQGGHLSNGRRAHETKHTERVAHRVRKGERKEKKRERRECGRYRLGLGHARTHEVTNCGSCRRWPTPHAHLGMSSARTIVRVLSRTHQPVTAMHAHVSLRQQECMSLSARLNSTFTGPVPRHTNVNLLAEHTIMRD